MWLFSYSDLEGFLRDSNANRVICDYADERNSVIRLLLDMGFTHGVSGISGECLNGDHPDGWPAVLIDDGKIELRQSHTEGNTISYGRIQHLTDNNPREKLKRVTESLVETMESLGLSYEDIANELQKCSLTSEDAAGMRLFEVARAMK